MGIVLVFTAWISATEGSPEPASYLERVALTVECCRADIPSMEPVAEEAARRLAAGGRFWVAGQLSMVSELSSRAGGIMMLRRLEDTIPGSGDVVLFFPEQDRTLSAEQLASAPYVIGFGKGSQEKDPCFPNHADRYGVSPTLANALPAWIFTGELIAALTRLGKMPVIYETIGAYGGYARIAQYQNGEIPFHEDRTVPPMAPGILGNRFADAITGMLRRVDREDRAGLDQAGAWAREAQTTHKALFMYSMGHLLPEEIAKTEIGARFKSATWNAGFRVPAPEDKYQDGDLAVLIGYQHPATQLLQLARPAGARVVYVSLFADRDFKNDPGVVWIDPMWDWADGCVSLDDYDIPMLPASSIINGAIAWEIYRVSTLP